MLITSALLFLTKSVGTRPKAKDPDDILLMSKVKISPHTRYQDDVDDDAKCDDIFLGAWEESCFIMSDPNGVFPGTQGTLSFPILIVRASDGGFDLFGYSIRNPFFSGANYWELGHGTPSRVESPTPTTHCVARFKSKLLLGKPTDEWSFDDDDYYWNRSPGGSVFSGNGNGAVCHFRRLHGTECREMVDATIARFSLVNVTVTLPISKSKLCE